MKKLFILIYACILFWLEDFFAMIENAINAHRARFEESHWDNMKGTFNENDQQDT